MKSRLAVFAFLLLSAFSVAQNNFTVGTASAAPGQKAFGTIDVPARADAATSIPVAVFHGAKPGPVLALVSGSHGTEYASIVALERLIETLDPAQISGTVIILPLVNIPSFEQKVPHVNPVDGKSMNRFYPGNPEGTQTERVSWQITKQVVERCDYLIDYHGGDLDENLRPYAYWPKSGNAKQDATTRDMVLAFGLDTIIVWSDRPVNGTLNAMRYLKMLPGAARPVENPVWVGKIDTVASEQPGIFYPLVDRGTYVAQGTKIGYVTDYFGRVVYEAKAPAAGVVLYICGVPSMKKGDTIANIGEITNNP